VCRGDARAPVSVDLTLDIDLQVAIYRSPLMCGGSVQSITQSIKVSSHRLHRATQTETGKEKPIPAHCVTVPVPSPLPLCVAADGCEMEINQSVSSIKEKKLRSAPLWLIYDMDDDLTSAPNDLPERTRYQSGTATRTAS